VALEKKALFQTQYLVHHQNITRHHEYGPIRAEKVVAMWPSTKSFSHGALTRGKAMEEISGLLGMNVPLSVRCDQAGMGADPKVHAGLAGSA
jgi:hypothetical protein